MNIATRLLGMTALVVAFAGTPAFADDDSPESFRTLTAQWWQWATSIPVPSNPVSDATGANCFVGQRGSIWFLAGTSNGGPTVRTCSVPEGTPLFFPVVNVVNVNTPNLPPGTPDFSVSDLRAQAAFYVDGARGMKVLLDNREIKSIRRVRSIAFATVFPQDNLFGPNAGLVPGKIYSPAIDDGFYVKLPGLSEGQHHLKIQGELPAFGATVDVDYILNVVKVTVKD